MVAKKKNIGSSKPATKGDLEDLREDLQADLVNALEASENRLHKEFKSEISDAVNGSEARLRKEMRAMEARILHHFDASVEYIHQDVARANDAEISLIKDHVKANTADIKQIKAHVGIV